MVGLGVCPDDFSQATIASHKALVADVHEQGFVGAVGSDHLDGYAMQVYNVPGYGKWPVGDRS
jgi:hypothetical protein